MQQMTMTKVRTGIDSRERIDSEVSKVGIGVIGVASGLVAAWSIACLVGGVVASGGPLNFIASWFGAVVGF
ncbi:MAG: hypothetical protein BWK76_01715 [Desulfobulbaceae bacterium A2]|nr:MAG: hypothetical protein BWK76_01715 [Desulfobulbaceae bacterium A2]